MQKSCKPLILFFGLAFVFGASISSADVEHDDVLQLTIEAGDWLAEQGQAQASGTAWPADAHKADSVSYDLGSGTAGVVVFYLSLYTASGEQRFLEHAVLGGEYLVSLLDDAEAFGNGSRRSSLYAGIAGVGVALELLADHSPEFAPHVDRVVAILDEWQVSAPAGVHWSDEFNDLIFGDAGTALFLAWYAQRNNDERAMQLALSAGRFLLAEAQAADQGRYWLFRRSKPFNIPGFSHGTAGIAYVLGTLGELTDEAELTTAAADGFAYIDSIAEVDGGKIRIPYGWPAEQWEGLYEFGWAHGLVGSNVFFARLQQLDIQAAEAARYNALVINTLANMGLPANLDESFAEPSTPLDWRFGRASVLAMLSDSGRGDVTRDAIWMYLEGQAVRGDSVANWEVDAPAFMGGGRAAFTGLFHGNAGIGLALLRMHAAMTGKAPYVTMPDDSFAWTN